MAAEKNFENKVKAYLTGIGSWYIKYWAGAAYTKEGIPDILACINGSFYGIEVKAENGSPTMMQLVNLVKIRHAGGIGVLLYPKDFDGFKAYISGDNNTWYADNIALQNQWCKKLLSKS